MRRRDLLTGLLATTTSSALPTAGLSMPPINDETNALAGGGGTTGPTGGLITNFSNAQNARIKIDGAEYNNVVSTKSYAIAKVDDYTLRFEIRSGDKWNYDSAGIDRSEISGGIGPGTIPASTPVTIAWRILVEPGGANTASWFVTSEWHNDDGELPSGQYTSPPWAVEMLGDKWSVKTIYCPAGGDPRPSSPDIVVKRPWTATTNIVRDQWYVFETEFKTDLTNGYLRLKVDGVQVVNYSGPLGYGCSGYFLIGLYRDTNATTFAAKIKNITTSWAPNK
jgi:hypothetical protein